MFRWCFTISIFVLPQMVFAQKTRLQTNYYSGELKESEGKVDKDGRKTGLWTFWDANGNLVMTAEYKNGLLHGEKKVEDPRRSTGLTHSMNPVFYEPAMQRQLISKLDTVIERINYREGRLNGLKTVYTIEGERIAEIEFKDDLKHGQERMYEPRGDRLTERHFYYEGKTDSAYFYNKLSEIQEKRIIKGDHQISRYYMAEKLYQQIESYEVDGGIERISCYWGSGGLEKCDTLMEYYMIADEDSYVVPDEPLGDSPSEEIFVIAEEMPEFPGGIAELYKYIQSTIKIDSAKVQKPVEKNIFVGFVVRKDGSITDVKILRGIEPELDNAVIEIISKMPKWVPGTMAGRAVHVEYKMPVKIKISE